MATKEHTLVAKELRARPDGELRSLLSSKQEELFRMRFKHKVSRVTDIHRLRELRRDIARLHTVLGESSTNKE